MQSQTLSPTDIVTFQYPLHSASDRQVFYACDMNSLNPKFKEDINTIQAIIERPVIVIDGINLSAIEHANELLKTLPNLFVIILPNIEAVLSDYFGDKTFFSYTLDGHRDVIKLYTMQLNQITANAEKLVKNNLSLIYDKAGIGEEFLNFYGRIGGNASNPATRKLVVWAKNYIWFYSNIFSSEMISGEYERCGKYILDLFEKYYDTNRDIFTMTPDQLKLRQIAKEMSQYIGYLFSERKSNLKQKLKDNNRAIREIYERACRLERENSDTATIIRSLSTKASKETKEFWTVEAVQKNIEPILGEKKYKEINCNYPLIVVETDDIYVESHKKKYLIGKFKIDINLLECKITFQNQTKPYDAGEQTIYDHPHILNGVACFGNYKEHINKMLVDNDIVTLLQTLLVFLQEYNDGQYGGAPYVMVERYWGEPGDWNTEFQLPTLDPRTIERLARRERQAAQSNTTTRHPNFTVDGDDECSECGLSIHECVDNGDCDRNPETGEWN